MIIRDVINLNGNPYDMREKNLILVSREPKENTLYALLVERKECIAEESIREFLFREDFKNLEEAMNAARKCELEYGLENILVHIMKCFDASPYRKTTK